MMVVHFIGKRFPWYTVLTQKISIQVEIYLDTIILLWFFHSVFNNSMLQSFLHARITYWTNINFLNLFPLVHWMCKFFEENIWPTVGTDTYYVTKIWKLFCSSVYQAVTIDGCVSLSQRSIPGKYIAFWDTIEVLWPQRRITFLQ